MKEVILHLMNEISTLTPPINLLNLKQLFSSTPLTENGIPQELKSQFALLLSLKQQIEEHSSLTAELEKHKEKKQNIETLMKKSSDLQKEISELTKAIEQSTSEIAPLYKEIEQGVNESLPKRNLSIPSYDLPKYGEKQKGVVSEYYDYLSRTIETIDTQRAKFKLVLLKSQFDTIKKELSELDIQCPEENDGDRLQEILSVVETETKKLTRITEKWDDLQRRFAQQLSASDITQKETELKKQIEELDLELKRIEDEVTTYVLAKNLKEDLTKQFLERQNTSELIQEYENKIDGLLSNLNPSAWVSWYSNPKYNEEQQILKDSVQFLKLLDRQKELTIKHSEFIKQQGLLSKALPESPINEDVIQAPKQLVADAITLINSIPTYSLSTELSAESSPADFYLSLLSNMPQVTEQREKKARAFEKLQEICSLSKEIAQLNEHKFINEQLPTLQEAEKANESEADDDRQKGYLKKQIDLCQSYLEATKQIDLLLRKQGQTTNEIKTLIEQLRLPSNQPLKIEELDSIQNKLSNIENQIQFLVTELNQLLPPKIGKEVDTGPSVEAQQNRVIVEEIPATMLIQPPLKTLTPEMEIVQREEVIQKPLSPKDSLLPPQNGSDLSLEPSAPSISTNPLKAPTEQLEENIPHEIAPDSTRDGINKNTPLQGESLPTRPTPTENVSLVDRTSTQLKEITSEKPYKDSSTKVSSEPGNQQIFNTPIPQNVKPLDIHKSSESEEDFMITLLDEVKNPIEINPINTPSEEGLPIGGVVEQPSTLLIDHLSKKAPTSGNANPQIFSSSSHPSRNPNSDPVSSLSPSQIYEKKLDILHSQITECLKQHSEEIQLWYKNVYESITASSLFDTLVLKALQLLKDILFELQAKKNDLSVIQAYMRLCLDPKQDLNKLLVLKPALPIIEKELADIELELNNWPVELQKFQLQYLKLKTEYPIEAELFLQAAHSLVSIKLSIEQSGSKEANQEQIPLITKDPRYDPLKRHRGLIKIWECLEDFFRMLIGKLKGQEEYEYTKRPCFFNTRSSKLLEEAESMTHSMLSVNN
ncbi:hypothetical protein EP47_00390 [Legionella norrlandica]|uniref:Interaptin n=1 Tax=Legionella norrlandica TaxID=1498499 RepID=A0A0A2SY41_9GAMM|nr:hypothetical protein [Legionella norrlandica]KGP64339.1 hypothetical protein EP47_00390 [Legionella norrlandica]